MSGFNLYVSTKLQRLHNLLPYTTNPHKKELINLCIDRLQTLYGENYRYFSGPQTQKIRGLQYTGVPQYWFGELNKRFNMNVLPYEIPKFDPQRKPLFARPCPMKPRHGFVDSRIVKSWKDILDIYKETIAEESEGEVILMRPLSGKYSGVATNAGVVWGSGNNSATNGDDGTIFIPSSVDTFTWNAGSLLVDTHYMGKDYVYQELNKLSIYETNYLEIVEDQGNIHVVQRRNGPSVPAQVDFIPKDMQVKRILHRSDTDGSLLGWEKYIKEIPEKEKDGVVFSHVKGNLSSHWAVHAIEHNIPVVCSQHVYFGQKLKAATINKHIMSTKDLMDLKKGIAKWLSKDFILPVSNLDKYILYTTIGTIHSMSRWDNSPHLMTLRCVAIASLIRFLCAACVGELRYWNKHGPGRDMSRDGDDVNRANLKTKIPGLKYIEDKNRNSIWTRMLSPLTLNKRLKIMNSVYYDFGCAGWDRNYGGCNWQAVTLATNNLITAVMLFLRKPTNSNWVSVITTINIALHTAHNNGLAVSKWIANEEITKISQSPTLGFLNSFCAEVVLGLYNKKRGYAQFKAYTNDIDDRYFKRAV